MDTHKKILIDGMNTVVSNGYFIKDEIPRQLAGFYKEGFDIWFITDTYEDKKEWEESTCIPEWLKNKVIIMDFDYVLKERYKLSNDSLIITNRNNFWEKLGLKTVSYTETKILPLNIADVIFCFGFTKMEFVNFCKEAKLIGILKDKFFNLDNSKVDGVAFMITDNNLQQESEFAIACINKLIGSKKYTIKHNKKAICITNKGKGIENVDFEVGDVILPVILI